MHRSTSRKALVVSALIAVIAVTVLAAYVIQKQVDQKQQAAQTAEPPATAADPDPENDVVAAPSDREVVVYTNDGFTPNKLTVKKGTILTVKNESSRPVQFSSDNHPSHRENQEMNLKVLAPGEATSYNAGVIGTWGFHDHLDERHTGSITVEEK